MSIFDKLKRKLDVPASPIVGLPEDDLIDFPQAMQAVKDGKSVSKAEWVNRELFLLLEGGFLKISRHGALSQVILKDGDVLSNDWFII